MKEWKDKLFIEKRATYHFKNENNSIIAPNFYQHGNKVWMFETLKEVDEETVTKEIFF